MQNENGINGSNESKRKITLAMLEAYFNALPELLKYIDKKIIENNDMDAKTALSNFQLECGKENPRLEPSEIVFGFMTCIIKNFPEIENIIEIKDLAILSAKFCDANRLGTPGHGFASKMNIPNFKDE